MFKFIGAMIVMAGGIAGCGGHHAVRKPVPVATPPSMVTPTPGPNKNTVAWANNTIQVVKQMRGGILQLQAGIDAYENHDTVTANQDFANSSTTFLQAQYTYDNGPLPPKKYEIADLDVKLALQDYEQAVTDVTAGLKVDSVAQVQQGVNLLKAGNAAMQQATRAEGNA